jgi:hypothetical protein
MSRRTLSERFLELYRDVQGYRDQCSQVYSLCYQTVTKVDQINERIESEEFDMSRRVSQEQFANMERMLLEYSKGYEGIYAICWQLSAKVDELNRQVTDLIRQNADNSSDLGDK